MSTSGYNPDKAAYQSHNYGVDAMSRFQHGQAGDDGAVLSGGMLERPFEGEHSAMIPEAYDGDLLTGESMVGALRTPLRNKNEEDSYSYMAGSSLVKHRD